MVGSLDWTAIHRSGGLHGHSFDHFIGASQDRLWDREPECLCSIEIDDEIEQCRLHHREVSGLISVEHPPDIGADLTVYPGEAWAVANQSASIDELRGLERRQRVLGIASGVHPVALCRLRIGRGELNR